MLNTIALRVVLCVAVSLVFYGLFVLANWMWRRFDWPFVSDNAEVPAGKWIVAGLIALVVLWLAFLVFVYPFD